MRDGAGHMGTLSRVRALIAVVVLATVAGCAAPAVPPEPVPPPVSSARPPGAAPPAAVGPADWPTYHHDNARTGVAGQLAPLGTLRRAWQARLDGAVYGQPLVIGNRVIAATERNTVYALDAADGHVLWSASLGEPTNGSELPCGNIDPLGITGTPVIDEVTRAVYLAAMIGDASGAHHRVFALSLKDGAPLPGLSKLTQRGRLSTCTGCRQHSGHLWSRLGDTWTRRLLQLHGRGAA